MLDGQSENPNLVVEGKLADNERLKRESNFLRGTIEEDLQDRVTGGFTNDNFQHIDVTAQLVTIDELGRVIHWL